jgi:hypothetical protein
MNKKYENLISVKYLLIKTEISIFHVTYVNISSYKHIKFLTSKVFLIYIYL